MKRLLLPLRGGLPLSYPAWLLVMNLMIVAPWFALVELPAEATSLAMAGSQDAAWPSSAGVVSGVRPSHPSAASRTVQPAWEGDTGATEALAHVAFLPLIATDSRGPYEAPYGVQLFALNAPIAAKTADVGAGWVRLSFYWYLVEPVNTTPEHYLWPTDFEGQLAELSAGDINVILTFVGNPSWAATYPGGPIDRVDVSELAQFMEAAVARYSAPPYNVKYWEFYNEPDNGNPLYAKNGWGYFGYQPQAYVDLLAAVYQPMKDADPETQIVLGGLAYDAWTSTGGPFVEDFLDRVLENGGAEFFDVMNFHYYPAFHQLWDPYGKDIIGKTTFLRRKLAAYGVHKPFVCTETGMWSDEAHGGSDERQSRYIVQVLARAMAADLRTTIWFALTDETSVGTWKYGLLNPDLTPKPAYFAYQTFSQQIPSVDYVRSLAPTKGSSDRIEAYEFIRLQDPTRVVTAWSTDELPHTLVLGTDQAIVVGKYGAETTVYDSDDGTVDSRVHVSIGPSPVYVRFQP